MFFTGCDLLTGSKSAEEIALSEARDRWRSLGLEDYSIDKTRSCECLPPYRYTLLVREGSVSDVVYELPQSDSTDVQDRQSLLKSTRSVEQMFKLLEHYVNRAYEFRATYHPEYGYPTEIEIDPVMRVQGEEIYRTLENLRFEGSDEEDPLPEGTD